LAIVDYCILGVTSSRTKPGVGGAIRHAWVSGNKGHTVDAYDPAVAPDPTEWLALDEGERIHLAEEYHRESGESAPNPRLHATFHNIIETQIAMGDELPVRRTIVRLMQEGLDRHDAIHAIAAELSETIYDVLKGPAKPGDDPNRAYFAALERLTARGWRKKGR
jgi:hypothetical protein